MKTNQASEPSTIAVLQLIDLDNAYWIRNGNVLTTGVTLKGNTYDKNGEPTEVIGETEINLFLRPTLTEQNLVSGLQTQASLGISCRFRNVQDETIQNSLVCNLFAPMVEIRKVGDGAYQVEFLDKTMTGPGTPWATSLSTNSAFTGTMSRGPSIDGSWYLSAQQGVSFFAP